MIFFVSLWFLFASLSAYEFEVSIAAVFRDEAPYMEEWIEYHRAIGVDHFWLYNDCSVDEWQQVLQPYMDAKIVEVIDWKEARDRIQIWPTIQIEAFKHAFEQSIGKTRWLAFIDTDEFLLPLQERSIQECLKNHFTDKQALYIQWLVFGTSGHTLMPGDSMLKKCTRCLPLKHSWNCVGKSIVRPEYVQYNAIFNVHHFPLHESVSYVDGSGDVIPFMKNDRAESDLSVTSHRSNFLRINHYFFRDEKFFREVKIPRKLQRGLELGELYNLYLLSMQNVDIAIVKLLDELYQVTQ